MDFAEIVKYLADNLEIEIDSEFQDCSNNQDITVTLKIGDTVISKSEASVFVDA